MCQGCLIWMSEYTNWGEKGRESEVKWKHMVNELFASVSENVCGGKKF